MLQNNEKTAEVLKAEKIVEQAKVLFCTLNDASFFTLKSAVSA